MKLPTISSLYGRIFAIFWFTMLLVLFAVLAVPHLDPRQSHQITKDHLQRIEKITKIVERRYGDAPNLTRTLQQMKEHNKHKPGPEFYLTDLEGNLITQERGRQKRYVQNFISDIDLTSQPKQKLYGRIMLAGPFPIKIAKQDLLLFSAIKWNQPPSFLIKLFDRPFQLLLVVMAVSTPLLLWLAWALSQPARRLEQAAQRVAKGEFVVDPNLEKGPSEFRQAGASFNQMVLAVNQMISGQQRLLSDISHELRSPLTRLRMANALATRKQGSSSELQRIDTEAERLEQMISELLKLSRMQVNSHQERETLSAQALWGALLDDAQFEAEQCNKTLQYQAVPNCQISGNPSLLMSALENIVRNAIHYSQHSIQISFNHTSDNITIVVEDDGNGVPEEELIDIFRPFYRVSTARDRHSGGAGLGLAITESAIRQHNGQIVASKSQLGGLQVSITLPTT
ncbi:envelope stress sensor histidine kinase CpxA [Vibrio tapetis]|uniref:histidine kinase n=1 Tax=Vibrio tapetis subsp. tapetis TaxID=1671868 RepID=A0A2N8ZFZ9_9VIBR|nr:envelope stress sensor histidine kinase CpxA [Vibrio tapetis]SON50842.1 sensory histidine kinase in two-component regulatory system with CpxR [Vibrio tapetis subsp. tapetis]